MKVFKKILNAVVTMIVVVMFACILALVGGRPFGYYPYTVLSGSMEPTYPVGSLIYVEEVPDPSLLVKGDVITYMISRDTTVTHRINDIVVGEDGQTRFETKGDANDYADEALVHPDNVIGTPVFSVPKVGYLVEAVKEPPGTYLAISFVAVVVFLMFLPDLLPEGKKEEEGEEDEASAAKKEEASRDNREEDEALAPRGRHARNAAAAKPASATRPAPASAPAQRTGVDTAAATRQIRIPHSAQLQHQPSVHSAYGHPAQQYAQPHAQQPARPQPRGQQPVNPLYRQVYQPQPQVDPRVRPQVAPQVQPQPQPRPQNQSHSQAPNSHVRRAAQPVNPGATTMFRPTNPGAYRQAPTEPEGAPKKRPTPRRRSQ